MTFYGNPTGGFWSEISKFFDPVSTDWDNYQARELGYAFEYIDAQTVLLLNKIPFFSYGFRSHHANHLRHSDCVSGVFHRKGTVTGIQANILLGLSLAFSAFNANARDARFVLSMRKDSNRILGRSVDSLPDSLAETVNQRAKCRCLHTAGFRRLFVVYHG